jgi:prepilin-type N-terminal cleavage/methylation domain-containing protein
VVQRFGVPWRTWAHHPDRPFGQITVSNPAHTTRSRRQAGFTLVELLVVVAVIALLIGLLLPALTKAREQGRLMICLNNARTITMAANSYAADNDGLWPVFPSYINEGLKFAAFNSWDYGGKTTSSFWTSQAEKRSVSETPLNPYVEPERPLIDPPGGRMEMPTYRCPSDPGTLQRKFWTPGTVPDPSITCYDDVGTSYQMNVQWWYEACRRAMPPLSPSATGNLPLWRHYEKMFKVANFRSAARFAWMYDQSMDFIAVGGFEKIGDHGGENKATASFMDGHVVYLTVTPKAAETQDYTLWTDRFYRKP